MLTYLHVKTHENKRAGCKGEMTLLPLAFRPA